MIRNSKGMTLVELIIIVVIIGIMSALAIPLLGLTPRSRLKAAARNVISDLQVARINAIRDGVRWRVSFDTGKREYSISRWTGPGPNDYTPDKTVPISDSSRIMFGSGHGSIPSGADPGDGITFNGNSVIFKPDGGTNMGGTIYLMEQKTKDTIAISILLNTGRVRGWRNFGPSDASWEKGRS